jgi:hypothetical protein
MADRDHPKTHVEDQDLKEPRKQPLSPRREGIDPLTESDTMYPAENTKEIAEKFHKKEAKADTGSGADKPASDHRTLEDHTDPENQPSPEQPASSSNEDADVDADATNNSNTDTDQEQLRADEELAENTEPGQPDDDTPDAGEQELDQEPHTDSVNTSPANRTTSTRSPKPRKG